MKIPITLALSLLAVAGPALYSQTAAVTETQPTPVLMSEFDVSTPQDHGYVATDSLLGSRVATKIQDLSFPVEVVTSQLMADFGMFEPDENVTFVSSFTGLSQGGQYNLRGFNQSYSLQDGFTRLGRYGAINIDRIEVIKGPNAAVYGEATPGGTLNVVTKEPRPQASQMLSYTGGSYHNSDSRLELTGPLVAHTDYIFDIGEFQRAYDVAFAEKRNEEAYLAIKHTFGSSADLEIKLDYFHSALDGTQQIIPYNYDPVAKVYTGTLATNLDDLSRTGPDSHHDRGIRSGTLIFEEQFGPIWSLRMGGNIYYATYNDFNNGVNTQYDIVAHTIGRGTPSLNLFNESGGAFQADLVAHYYLFNAKLENRELFTVDVNDYYKFDNQHSLAAAYTVAPYFNKTITVGQPFDYTLPDYNPVQYSTISNNYKNRGGIDGLMFRHQTTFLKGKVILFGSVREDWVDINLHDLTSTGIVQHANRKYFDPSVGFNAKILPGIAAYGSYSTGFDASIQGVTASATHGINPATTGWGDEYGIKASLLHDTLIFTAGGYYITKRNTTVTVLLPDGTTTSAPEGTQLSRGSEFDFSYAITKDLSSGGGFGHVNSKIIADGDATEAIGRKPAGIADNNVGVWLRYQFNGWLRGLYTNASYSYSSPTHPEGATTGDTITKGVYTGTNYEWAVKIPSYYYSDFALHYLVRDKHRITHTVNFIVKNVFNRNYINSNVYLADSRGFYLGYIIAH